MPDFSFVVRGTGQGEVNRRSRKVCNACPLQDQCTTNKSGRTIKRYLRQEDLDRMRQASRSAAARRNIRTRQHLMERSFARATRFGFDRARWRRLWRVKIQEYLVATVQNIEVLLRYPTGPRRAAQWIREQVQRQGTQPCSYRYAGRNHPGASR